MGGILERIYQISPAFIQNLGVTYYGLKVYNREYGKRFENLLQAYESQQWYSLESLKELQNLKLRSLIEHSYSNVPYYRKVMSERGLKPDDIKTAADLHKLPLLTRNDIQTGFLELTARNYKSRQLIPGHTSGTTGSPLQFYYDSRICLLKNVVDWRQKRLAGINFGDRIAFFLGRIVVPTSNHKPPYWRSNWTLNHMFFSSFHLSDENIDSYIRKLEQFDPVALEGYPSTAYIIARFLLNRKIIMPLKAVFTSSETLLPQQRNVIEEAFACKLYDFYGLAERVMFATECEAHEGHHVNMDFGITEILDRDNNPVSYGELGKIVATGLHNYGMPLIRYQTNDVTSLKNEPCSCGRGFPLMEDVTTKAEDIITTRSGRLITASVLTHPFKPMQNIIESQIIQDDPEHLRIKIVKLPSFTDQDAIYLKTELQKRVGDDMKIEIEFVDSIPRTKAGKFKWVISKETPEF